MNVHEFDQLVARRVLGFANVYGSYSTNDSAVRLVRNKIAELGLTGDFIGYLYARGAARDWDLMQASPREQCEAALAAVGNLICYRCKVPFDACRCAGGPFASLDCTCDSDIFGRSVVHTVPSEVHSARCEYCKDGQCDRCSNDGICECECRGAH